MEIESLRLDFPVRHEHHQTKEQEKQRSIIKSKDLDKKNNELEENLRLELCRHCRHRLLEPLVCVSSLFSLGF